MQLVDSHCHLTYEPMFSNLDQLILDCEKENISSLLSISTNLDTAERSIEIANKYEKIYTSIGLHPLEVKKNSKDLNKILNLPIVSKKIIAIGECGLDYYRYNDNKKEQISAFEQQIAFAGKNNLPVIIHTRSANQDMLSILKNHRESKIKFLIHCFSENLSFCEEVLNLGCYVSFSGIVTFKNAKEIQKCAKIVPLNKLMIETDSPYLSPEPMRGKSNNPTNVKYVAEKISEIKKISLDEIKNKTTENFNYFFSI